ncbi:hypothetical protein Ciccas_006063 [Cichlidogyrus casuarinus]|uniref:Eukaryotic peptide chain release factor subunit 1 n=1 Tax=Cichlidogyrus casuarinus TaxID=1844966 RepID=A0ABD2Q6W4_9PLAT
MQDGLAHVCLLTSSTTITRARIEVTIPKKRAGYPTTQHDKGVLRFFDQIIQAIERHIRFDVVKCVLIASPGFLKDQFFKYMMELAVKQDKRLFIDNKSKFMLVHCSTGHKKSLTEILTDPLVASKVANTKAAAEINALSDFYSMLQSDPSRAFYGIKHVETAIESGAVDRLLISDALFRSKDISERKRYVKMVDCVKESYGNLNNLSGVAAILRFPMADPQSDDDDDEEEEDD